MGTGGPGVVPGRLRPGLSTSWLRPPVAQAPRGEAAEGRVGRRHLVLASAQLRRRLHDRDRRRIGVSLAPGLAWRPPWLLVIGFGHGEMFWHRVIERLGHSSL